MPMPVPLPMPLPARRVNGMAITSLALGVLSLPTLGAAGLGAVATGHVAKAQIRARGDEGDGLATIGLVLGWLSVGGWVLLFLLAGLGALPTDRFVPGRLTPPFRDRYPPRADR